MVGRIRAHIEQHGQISVAEARDLFNTSRKYILPLMEHLDAIGLTVRDGDFRRLKKARE
jgi:selenocysteine-specific elongation factor